MIPWCVAGTLLISLIAQRLYNDAAGMSVGLCVAVKFTWIILILLLPLISLCDLGRKRFGPTLSTSGQLCVMGVIAVMFVNLTYGFVRTPVHRST